VYQPSVEDATEQAAEFGAAVERLKEKNPGKTEFNYFEVVDEVNNG
jgi:hypothetical protein